MPELVQMYDCQIFVKGTSFVGQRMELTAGVSQGTSTGEADDGNTKFSWRVTAMPTSGEIWIYSGGSIENILQWP